MPFLVFSTHAPLLLTGKSLQSPQIHILVQIITEHIAPQQYTEVTTFLARVKTISQKPTGSVVTHLLEACQDDSRIQLLRNRKIVHWILGVIE